MSASFSLGSEFDSLLVVGLARDTEGLLAVAFARAPPGILENHVVEEPAGVVVERLAGVLLAPANHQLAAGAIPRHLEDPRLEALHAPALVADLRPERVGVRDVFLLVEEPHLVPEDVA